MDGAEGDYKQIDTCLDALLSIFAFQSADVQFPVAEMFGEPLKAGPSVILGSSYIPINYAILQGGG